MFIEKDDPRILSGEAKPMKKKRIKVQRKGTVVVIDKNLKKHRISLSEVQNYPECRSLITRDILIENFSGERYWISSEFQIRDNDKIIFKSERKKPNKFIYYTPWGKYDSVYPAHKDCPYDISICLLKYLCNSESIITRYNRKIISVFGESVLGKTTNELGFFRIKN